MELEQAIKELKVEYLGDSYEIIEAKKIAVAATLACNAAPSSALQCRKIKRDSCTLLSKRKNALIVDYARKCAP